MLWLGVQICWPWEAAVNDRRDPHGDKKVPSLGPVLSASSLSHVLQGDSLPPPCFTHAAFSAHNLPQTGPV